MTTRTIRKRGQHKIAKQTGNPCTNKGPNPQICHSNDTRELRKEKWSASRKAMEREQQIITFVRTKAALAKTTNYDNYRQRPEQGAVEGLIAQVTSKAIALTHSVGPPWTIELTIQIMRQQQSPSRRQRANSNMKHLANKA